MDLNTQIYCRPQYVDNTTSEFLVWVRLMNRDTWPCPTTRFNISISMTNGIQVAWQPGFGGDVELFPGNYTDWIQLNATLPK
jgi:hypothetical protein